MTRTLTTDDPDHIHHDDDPRTFVFGSNLLGIHGGGAARYAAERLGALRGVGQGRTGRCYALPTCSSPGKPLALRQVNVHVAAFLHHAGTHPVERFFVSAVGCGIAGFTEEQVAPLFALAPDNCDLPPGWRDAVPAAIAAWLEGDHCYDLIANAPQRRRIADRIRNGAWRQKDS